MKRGLGFSKDKKALQNDSNQLPEDSCEKNKTATQREKKIGKEETEPTGFLLKRCEKNGGHASTMS